MHACHAVTDLALCSFQPTTIPNCTGTVTPSTDIPTMPPEGETCNYLSYLHNYVYTIINIQ